MTTDLTTMDENKPDGATETVSVLDNYDRETRKNLKDWGGVEHQLVGGRHKIPFGVTANRPTTDLGAGVLYINTTLGVVEYYTGSAWTAALTVFPAGTRMLFDQDSAPTGWTRDTGINDRVVNIVSGSRVHGGSWTITGMNGDPATTLARDGTGGTFSFPTVTHFHSFDGTWRPLRRDVIICSKD